MLTGCKAYPKDLQLHLLICSLIVTWDLGGNLVSVVDEPVPNPNPFQSTPTTTFTSGSYSEHTQTKTFQLVPRDPYVYSTAVLVTP